ncbi:hypothetical protein HanRHA438_Chr17g0813971 [Helianthus annuus]|nr:hypothetical protein HanIR_Chr17g0872041 [Helianthus annuus]KAJ0447616.1 hypothetical protein HanHA89_Chr17g0707361 [Helianthus annuus]KAJ0636364.1 hypothetical protein HanOQP8_Chr17g0661081 [Helianthus annuus]KAJ0819186.1 hypothetical protein HanLR1_Chr00c0247g0732571 [Helianthus annuus]KAJ0826407.1 hypothetical protein HanRHA438_Chr17g0813971 [Helianthus annuus]
MNHCGIHQKNTFASSCEEMRSSVSVSVSGVPMVCPKPRRLSLFSTTANEPVRPLRWQMCHQSEGFESKAGPELLDIIFAKSGGYGAPDQTCTQVASSPPFFSGSPPSRVSNPLIQDARFRDDKIAPVSPRSTIPNPAPSGLSSPSPRKGGCLLSNFGNKPAVRIEGFDCLDRDNRRNCSIPTLA